jgi:hypothetical protein
VRADRELTPLHLETDFSQGHLSQILRANSARHSPPISDTTAGFTAPAPAVVVTLVVGGWNATLFSSSQWISASTLCGGPNSSDLSCSGGSYVYQLCWTQIGSGSVSLQFLADNDEVVCFNNASCPPASSSPMLSSSMIGLDNPSDPASNFRDPTLNTPAITNAVTNASPLGEMNTLDINVGNSSETPSGLEVQGLLCGNVTLVAFPP